MYLCLYKINEHEIQQAQLLEMHRNAGFRNGNGKAIDGINSQPYFDNESCGQCLQLFYFIHHV